MRVFGLLLSLLICTTLGAEPAPIQQWIDEAIKAGGGVVTVPEGEHLLPEGLVIKDAQKLTLRGVDKESCVIKLASTSQRRELLTISGKSAEIQIIGLTFDNETGESESHITPISISRFSKDPAEKLEKIFIRDCLFQNFKRANIVIQEAAEVGIERCSFRDGGTAIAADRATQFTLRGNRMIRFTIAFDVKNSIKGLIQGNEVMDTQAGLVIHHDKTQASEDADAVTNNSFDGVKEALKLSPQTAKPKLEGNEGLAPQ